MQLEEFASRVKSKFEDDTGIPDITRNAFDPETIAMFIRVCGLNRALDREDALDVEATLLRRPLTQQETAAMELPNFTRKRISNQDSWWWACRGLVLTSLRRIVYSIRLFHSICYHTGEWDETTRTGNPMDSDIVRVCPPLSCLISPKDTIADIYKRVENDYVYGTLSAPKMDIINDFVKISDAAIRSHEFTRANDALFAFLKVALGTRRAEHGLYTTHSTRHTFAYWAKLCGEQDLVIKVAGRWMSFSAFAIYIKLGLNDAVHAAIDEARSRDR